MRSRGTHRFLTVGCGSIGKRHIRNLLSLGAGTVLAYDPRQDRRQEVAKELGVETVAGLDDAWERGVDVVLVTAPTALHVPLALQAAQRGCHLFVEKPLSDRWDGVDDLLEAVRERQLVTLVGCNMRFHPGLRRVRELLQEGSIGTVVAARVEYGQYLPDWHPWEDYRKGYSAQRALGGGIILDAIHEIDYTRWLLGEVATVACLRGRLSHLEIDTEDTAAILLGFVGGAIGEIHLDYVQRVPSRSCHLVGDGGTIRWDNAVGTRLYTPALGRWREYPNPDGWQPNDMYLDEMRHFLACLDGRERSEQDAASAADALGVALAAHRSASERVFVDLRTA